MRSSTGARLAECVSEPHPMGLEVRVHIGGDAYYTRVHSTLEGLSAEARSLATRMRAKGWVYIDGEAE